MTNIASLSSVYHKPPETFVANLADLEEEEDEEAPEPEPEPKHEHEPVPKPVITMEKFVSMC